jgi:hypothetical protein
MKILSILYIAIFLFASHFNKVNFGNIIFFVKFPESVKICIESRLFYEPIIIFIFAVQILYKVTSTFLYIISLVNNIICLTLY